MYLPPFILEQIPSSSINTKISFDSIAFVFIFSRPRYRKIGFDDDVRRHAGSRPITLLRLMLLMSRWAGGGDCFSPPFPYTPPRTVKIPFLRLSTRAHASSFVLECSYRFSFLSLSPDTRFNRALSNHSLFHGIRLGWREFKRAVRRAIV